MELLVDETPITHALTDVSHQFVSRLRLHPFIQRCRDRLTTQAEMERFLVQHGKYGVYALPLRADVEPAKWRPRGAAG